MARFPASARLRSKADFAALRAPNGRAHTTCFSLRWIRSDRASGRLGLAVSRKVSKRAVTRNRIKRVVRESFRERRQQLPVLDILVIAHAPAATTDNPALRADLEQVWRRLQALKPLSAPGTIGG